MEREYREYVEFVLSFPTKTHMMPRGMYWVGKAKEEVNEAFEVVNACAGAQREPNEQQRAHIGEELSDALFCIIYAASVHHLSSHFLPDLRLIVPFPVAGMVPLWKYWIDDSLEMLGKAYEIWNHCVEANRDPNEREYQELAEKLWAACSSIGKAAYANGISPTSLPELNRKKLEKRIREGRYPAQTGRRG